MKFDGIKYVGYGLIVGLFIAGLVITGIVYATGNTPPPISVAPPEFVKSPAPIPPTDPPAPTASPTLISSQTPPPLPPATVIPTDTPLIIPSPSGTPDAAEQMILDGKMVITGPLTAKQQADLYKASLNYIAASPGASVYMSKKINGSGNAHPTNICGPLALIIMQDAGLIEYKDVAPYDFWLLNPYIGKDRALLDRVFPEDRYEDTLFKTPLNKFDWNAFPLEPGDFLYIKHGTGGNFDHMLVVNRVDNRGRAYAVSNFGTEAGYIIDEVMLYDPDDPDTGMFHTWTEKQFAALGSTGFGGFELWRLRTP